MKTPHRLATILFADIQGYTALMEQNEQKALESLRTFQSSLENTVADNNGIIQNFYGDGCLATFYGSTDAVNCAVELQKSFWNEHHLPVRIGLHTGEVVFDESNVYGNAINTASRIESIGIPGSVLLSKAVASQIANNLHYKMVSLGVFEFKNLSDAIEVMAISEFNFQVPEREKIEGKLNYPNPADEPNYGRYKPWMVAGIFLLVLIFTVYIVTGDEFRRIASSDISEKGLYIPPFENQTGDSSLENIGHYTSMVLASAIQSTGMALVKDQATLDIGPTIYEAKISGFGQPNNKKEPTDLQFLLKGTYHKTNDSIFFSCRIMDLKSNSAVKVFPTVSSPFGNYTRAIERLKNEVLGYWATKDTPLYQYNPPNYQSYIDYLLAIQNWEGDTAVILKHIRNAKKLDSTFYRAHLLELELYEIYNPNKADSMLTDFELLKNQFSKAELNLYNAIKARVRNKNQAAFQYYMKEFETAPRNLYVNTSAISIALALINNPQKAVEIGEYIDWRTVPYNDCDYCQDRLTFLTKAYIDIGEEEKALEILRFAETSETDLINRGIRELEIRALARLGRIDEIKEILRKSRYQEFNQKMDFIYFTYWAARELILTGNMAEANEFANQFFSDITPENRNTYLTSIARLQLYLGNYDQAILDLKETLDTKYLGGYQPYFEAWYAAANGFVGNQQIARDYIEKFRTVEDKYKKQLYLYNKAIIHCSLGETDQAVSALKDAIYAGKRFYRWEFQYEPILNRYIPKESMDEVLTLVY